MTLNNKECKQIMQHIVKFGFTKAGISSTLHTAVRYGPRSLRCIGSFDTFVIQGTDRKAPPHLTILGVNSIHTTPSGQPRH